MTSSTLQQAVTPDAPVHEYKDLKGVSQRLSEQAQINLGHEAEVRRAHLDIATLKLEFAQFKAAAATPEPVPATAQSNHTEGVAETLAMMIGEINKLKLDGASQDKRIAALEGTLLQISSEITRAA